MLPIPSLATIKLAAIAAALAAAFWLGIQVEKSAWLAEKAELNAKAAEAIAASEQRVLEAERKSQAFVQAAASQYHANLEKLQNEKDAALAAAQSRGLFIDAECPSNRDPVPGPALRPPRDTGTQRARLPEATARALIALASEADRVTRQLTACQVILEKERQ